TDTLQRVARLAVPQLGDWCAIDVVDERGQIQSVAVEHPDPDRLRAALETSHGREPRLDDPFGVGAVIRTGRPMLVSDVGSDALAQYARDDSHLQILQSLGIVSVLCVPLASAGGAMGALTLVSTESKRRFTEADLDVAVRLGRRSGTAVEHA